MAEESNEGSKPVGPSKSQVDLSKSMLNLLKNIAKVTDKVTSSNSDQLDAINNMVDAIRERSEIEDEYVRKLESEHKSFDTLYNKERRRLKPLESMVAFNERLEKQYEKNNGHLRATATAIGQNLMHFEKLRKATAKVTSAIEAMRNMKKDFGKVLNSNTSSASKLVTVMSFGSKVMIKGFVSVGSILTKVTKELGSLSLNLLKLGSKLIVNSIKGLLAPFKMLFNATKTVAKAVYDLFEFLTNLPYKAMNEIAKLGNEIRKELVETIYQASENTKELFTHTGSLGESVANLKNIAAGSLLAFQNVNSNLVKLFGFGAAGIAEMVRETTERIAALGVHADIYGSSISKNTKVIEYFAMAQRALNLQTEDFGYIALQSRKNLVTMSDTVESFRHVIVNSAEAFSMNERTMGKGFFTLRKDITNFGHLSNIELTNVVGRMNELGVSIEDVAGLFSKFSTFEDAANSSAMLAQAFGMNIDALDLINAKDTGKIVDMFRNAMMETGRSFDMLNRHEKELMASQTGMSAQNLEMMMNFRNAGYTFVEAQKMMKDADPTQQQLKAMKEMTSAIKSLKKTMEFESPFDAMYQGMKQSLMKGGSEFRDFAMQISQGYENIYSYFASGNLTQALNNVAKPFMKLTENLSRFFFSSTFKEGIESATESLGKFLSMLFDNSNKITLKKLQDNFKDFFGKIFGLFTKGTTIANKQSIDFIERIALGLSSLGPLFLEQLREGFNSIYKFISSEDSTEPLFKSKYSNVWKGVFKDYKKQWGKLKDDPGVNAFFTYLKGAFTNVIDYFVDTIGAKIAEAITNIPGAELIFSDQKLVKMGKETAGKDKRSLGDLLGDVTTLDDLTEGADAKNTMIAAKLIEKAKVEVGQNNNIKSSALRKQILEKLAEFEKHALDSEFADDANAEDLIGALNEINQVLEGNALNVNQKMFSTAYNPDQILKKYTFEGEGEEHIKKVKEREKEKEKRALEAIQRKEAEAQYTELAIELQNQINAREVMIENKKEELLKLSFKNYAASKVKINKLNQQIQDLEKLFQETQLRGTAGVISVTSEKERNEFLNKTKKKSRNFSKELASQAKPMKDGFIPSGESAMIFSRGELYETLASDAIAVFDRNYAMANKPNMPTVNSNSSEAAEILRSNAEIIATVKSLIESNNNRPIELKADVKLDGKSVGSGLLNSGLLVEASKAKYGRYLNDTVKDSSTLANRETSSL